jgi:hypothetical protein
MIKYGPLLVRGTRRGLHDPHAERSPACWFASPAALSSPRFGSPRRAPAAPAPAAGAPPPLTRGASGLGVSTPSAAAAAASAATPNSAQAGSEGAFQRGPTAFEEGPPRIVMRWQEVEELRCCLVGVGGPASGVGGHAGPLLPLGGAAALRPGANRLHFLAAPVKRGLYKPLHVTAALEQLQMQLPVRLPPAPWQPAGAPAPLAGAARAPSPDPDLFGGSAQSGGTGRSGAVPEEAVLMAVDSAAPRLAISLAAAADGCLVGGQQQWLGLHVAPERDHLQAVRLEVGWPAPPGAPDVARKPSGLPGAAPAAPTLRKPALGGELAAPSAGALGDGGAPLLLPRHEAAVVVAAGGGSGGGGVVVRARAPAPGQPGWAAAEEGTQELHLPPALAAAGGAFTAWWWVDAAAGAPPAEQVRVAAPGGGGGHEGGFAGAAAAAPGIIGGAGMDGFPPAPPPALLELPVALEYVSGCRRSYCKQLAVPVRQPFAVHTTGEPHRCADTAASVGTLAAGHARGRPLRPLLPKAAESCAPARSCLM